MSIISLCPLRHKDTTDGNGFRGSKRKKEGRLTNVLISIISSQEIPPVFIKQSVEVSRPLFKAIISLN